MWVIHGAEDDLCVDLEGQIWELDDPTMKQPVDDTHPNCVCTLDDIDIFDDTTIPPPPPDRQTALNKKKKKTPNV